MRKSELEIIYIGKKETRGWRHYVERHKAQVASIDSPSQGHHRDITRHHYFHVFLEVFSCGV